MSAATAVLAAGRLGRVLAGLPDEQARAMVGITATSFGITLGIGVIFPLVPIFARDLGISITAVGSLVGAFGIARIVVGVAGGPIFARWSERAVGAAGAGTVAVGSLLTAVAGDFTGLLVARVVHGLGVALFVAAGLVYIGRAVPASHRGRLMGLHQGSMLLATSVGPVVGALLASVGGVRLPFLVAAGLGVLGCLYAVRSFPSSGAPAAAAEAAHRVSWDGWRWTAVVMLVGSFVTWGMRGAVRFTLTPIFVTEELGASLSWSGIVLAVMSVGDIVGLVLGGRWLDRWGRRVVFAGASALTAASILAFPVAGALPALFAVSAVFGVVGGMGAVAPAAMAADLAGGTASVLTGSRLVGDIGVLLGPWGASALLDLSGFGVAYGAVAAASAVAAVATLTGRETMGLGGAAPTALAAETLPPAT